MRLVDLEASVRDLQGQVKDLKAELSDKQPPERPAGGFAAGPGPEAFGSQARRFDARLLKESYGLWTFVETEGVEPTNNHGERV